MKRLVALLVLVAALGFAAPALANDVYGHWEVGPSLAPAGGTIFTSGGIQIGGTVVGCPMVQFQDAIYADGVLVAVEPAQYQCWQALNNVATAFPGYACPASGVHAWQHIIGYRVNWLAGGWGPSHYLPASIGTVGNCR